MKSFIYGLAAPMLRAFGIELENKDADHTGKDDIAGATLEYTADVLEAVLQKKDIPYPTNLLAVIEANKQHIETPPPSE